MHVKWGGDVTKLWGCAAASSAACGGNQALQQMLQLWRTAEVLLHGQSRPTAAESFIVECSSTARSHAGASSESLAHVVWRLEEAWASDPEAGVTVAMHECPKRRTQACRRLTWFSGFEAARASEGLAASHSPKRQRQNRKQHLDERQRTTAHLVCRLPEARARTPSRHCSRRA